MFKILWVSVKYVVNNFRTSQVYFIYIIETHEQSFGEAVKVFCKANDVPVNIKQFCLCKVKY